MANYILCSTVRSGTVVYWPGRIVDAASPLYGNLVTKGALFYPESNASIAAAAVVARDVKKTGGSVEDAERIMKAAVDANQQSVDTTEPRMMVLRIAVGTDATTDSSRSIPAGAVVHKARFSVTTPFSAGATVKFGVAGTLAKFGDTGDFGNIEAVSVIDVEQDTEVADEAPLRVTIGNAPAAGAGKAIIFYSVPGS